MLGQSLEEIWAARNAQEQADRAPDSGFEEEEDDDDWD